MQGLAVSSSTSYSSSFTLTRLLWRFAELLELRNLGQRLCIVGGVGDVSILGPLNFLLALYNTNTAWQFISCKGTREKTLITVGIVFKKCSESQLADVIVSAGNVRDERLSAGLAQVAFCQREARKA